MEAKTVSREARKHVQVDMENLLPRDFTIRKKQIHAIAGNNAASQRSCQTLRDSKHLCAGFGIQAREKTRVLIGNHKQMSGIHGTDIEKCRA